MSSRFADNSLFLGRTPRGRLNRIAEGADAMVLAQIQGRYSVAPGALGLSRVNSVEQVSNEEIPA